MNGESSRARSGHAINFVVLVVLLTATWFRMWSPWGLLFIYWTVPNFYTGRAFLVSDVSRDEAPLLFWLIQLTWLILGIMMILTDFLPGWA